jgi:phage tail sheath protein FI
MATTTRRTPGVYLTELDAFPPSVVGVLTAVPAFIGYTEKAVQNGQPITNKPIKINSVDDYSLYFGGPPNVQFSIVDTPSGQVPDFTVGGNGYSLTWDNPKFYLYNCVRLFYENGGGPCYVVSVGDYANPALKANLETGLTAISHESGPTMLLVPDALLLSKADYSSIMSKMLGQCNTKQDRVSLLDVHGGATATPSGVGTLITDFRADVGANNLNYGIGYFPWLNTSIVQNNEIIYTNIATLQKLKDVLKAEAAILYVDNTPKKEAVDALIDRLSNDPAEPYTVLVLSQDVGAAVPLLFSIYRDIQRKLNVLPPAPAMAGIYTMVDATRGVWKAPANVSLTSVVSPTIYIDDEIQADMNVPLDGKAVNAIRSFIGQGILVWGARTLDGNSRDYRYVNVRRTLIFIEQSLKIAAGAYLFEPNDANTWVSVKSMIEIFLMGVWQAGGLMGDKASDAYVVNVGLGSTMTGMDILDGYMRIQVLLQMLRPAEFIEITFQQKMQGV